MPHYATLDTGRRRQCPTAEQAALHDSVDTAAEKARFHTNRTTFAERSVLRCYRGMMCDAFTHEAL